MGALLLVTGCSNGQSSSAAKTEGTSAAAVEDSPAQDCTRDVLAALALKWREDTSTPLDEDGRKLLQAFLDANAVKNTPQYHIFMDHLTAGMSPLALAVMHGRDHEEAITEQLGAESEGVAADCAAAAG